MLRLGCLRRLAPALSPRPFPSPSSLPHLPLNGPPILSGAPSAFSAPVRGLATRKHKKLIKMAKGYRNRAKNVYSVALQRVHKALQYAYRDRKVKKREFRKTWIERINAAGRQHGIG